MKLSSILEDDENMAMIPLSWLTREDRQKFIRDGYEVIPISGYQETNGYRAFKIIGPFDKDNYWIHEFSIPIWEDWKLTAHYATNAERHMSTSGQQMFDRLDDDEKIKALIHTWYENARSYINKYFEDHPDLLKHAKNSLKLKDINHEFKDLFTKV